MWTPEICSFFILFQNLKSSFIRIQDFRLHKSAVHFIADWCPPVIRCAKYPDGHGLPRKTNIRTIWILLLAIKRGCPYKLLHHDMVNRFRRSKVAQYHGWNLLLFHARRFRWLNPIFLESVCRQNIGVLRKAETPPLLFCLFMVAFFYYFRNFHLKNWHKGQARHN